MLTYVKNFEFISIVYRDGKVTFKDKSDKKTDKEKKKEKYYTFFDKIPLYKCDKYEAAKGHQEFNSFKDTIERWGLYIPVHIHEQLLEERPCTKLVTVS